MAKRTKAKKVTDQNKPWFSRSSQNRVSKAKNAINTFLIYCEGQSTEPAYFDSFPVTTETKIETIGLGMARKELIGEVIKRIQTEKNKDEYDEIWCVFDRDLGRNKSSVEIGKENQNFNDAVELAERNGIKVAYSNDSFELWLVLHQQFIQAAMHRDRYFEILSNRFGINYEKAGKEKHFAKTLYLNFQSQQKTAIKFAKKLNEKHQGLAYSDRNPCTTVHLLVEELNKCLRK